MTGTWSGWQKETWRLCLGPGAQLSIYEGWRSYHCCQMYRLPAAESDAEPSMWHCSLGVLPDTCWYIDYWTSSILEGPEVGFFYFNFLYVYIFQVWFAFLSCRAYSVFVLPMRPHITLFQSGWTNLQERRYGNWPMIVRSTGHIIDSEAPSLIECWQACWRCSWSARLEVILCRMGYHAPGCSIYIGSKTFI